MSRDDRYASQAERWSERSYADPAAYLDHRAELVVDLAAPLVPRETVLDLACGDGQLGLHLRARGLDYRGVDAEPAMVDAAARLLGPGVVELGDLDTYLPSEPVACTTVFRAIYYARDRTAFFRHVRGYTTRKLVFDLDPRRFDVDVVVGELEAAGFARPVLHPFLVSQTHTLPSPLAAVLRATERSTTLSGLLLRARFTYLVAAAVER